ncbi:MAG TPA: FixH family protein, partial [Burkholderiaceae bacterium]|nr:FixH family protein [Burkholderiaceae bacterium]
REPYVWMVVGIPVLAICLGVLMLTLARNGADSLVDDNYYKRGVEINKVTAARQRAAQLRMGLFVTQQPGGVCAHLQGDSVPGAGLPLNLRLAHVARRELDVVLTFTSDSAGRCAGGATDRGLQSRTYWAQGAVLPRGQWSASLAAQDWQLARRLGPVDGQVLEIDSQAER